MFQYSIIAPTSFYPLFSMFQYFEFFCVSVFWVFLCFNILCFSMFQYSEYFNVSVFWAFLCFSILCFSMFQYSDFFYVSVFCAGKSPSGCRLCRMHALVAHTLDGSVSSTSTLFSFLIQNEEREKSRTLPYPRYKTKYYTLSYILDGSVWLFFNFPLCLVFCELHTVVGVILAFRMHTLASQTLMAA